MRGETNLFSSTFNVIAISIHSPHARGDDEIIDGLRIAHISIHSPHARGDLTVDAVAYSLDAFQSTPLMRGETFAATQTRKESQNFNPLPSCEGRHDKR